MNLKIALVALSAMLVFGATYDAIAADADANMPAKAVTRVETTPTSISSPAATAQSETLPVAGRRTAPGGNPEAEYRVGPQDLIEIVVYGLPELARTVRVNAKGQISLPLIGQVDATGLTASALERTIAERLSEKYLQNPQVTVFIKEFTTLRFTVEGAVNKPGVYPLVGQMTLLRALAVAGGQGPLSDMTEVLLFRVTPVGESISVKYDATKIRTGEAQDPLIQNDDLVVVNRSKARAAFKDSLFRDILDVLNPIPFLR
jgi:polysaccharide biosynthesis/export protein